MDVCINEYKIKLSIDKLCRANIDMTNEVEVC